MKHTLIVVFAIVFLLCAASHSFADDTEFFSYYVTPMVQVIVDVSGSMTWDMYGCRNWGDGSQPYGTHDYAGRDTDGNGLPDDSRMYILKSALYAVLNDPEIRLQWGLASFVQNKNWSQMSSAYYRDADSFPPNPPCTNWPSSGYPYVRPRGYWQYTTRTYAYQAFMERVPMADGDSAQIANISRWVDQMPDDSIELRGLGNTPIQGSLRGARYKYQDILDADTTGERWCRRHFVLLLTDGEPTQSIEWASYDDGKSALWDGGGKASQCAMEAESLMHTYIPYNSYPNHDQEVEIRTYVVGIGLVGSQTLTDIAAAGGTNDYYFAGDPTQLQEVLRTILSEIMSIASSYAGSEVTSIQEEFITQGYEAKMYLCSFVPSYEPIWDGHLKCIKLVPGTFDIDSIPDSLLYWDAGEILENTPIGSRSIYTEKNGLGTVFSSANITAADLGVATDSMRDVVINTVYSGSPTGTMGFLGDIFHSTPLRIHGPNYFYEDDEFYRYRAYQDTTRASMIYAGANDGMLHCFNDSTGEEQLAFIPNDQLTKLQYLLTEHKYYEDANVMAADVWFPSSPTDTFKDWTEWKTVLFFGQRQGGRYYSALDVTNPFSPDFFFNFNVMGYLGETWSDPVVFKVHKNTLEKRGDRFFGFVGGGYWPDSLYDKYNPPQPPTQAPYGNVIVSIDVYNCCTHYPPTYGADYWGIFAKPGYGTYMRYPFAAQPSVIDTNLDSYADILYIGDVAGQLWKTDLTSEQVMNWRASLIFQAPKPDTFLEDSLWQPIFFPVTYSLDEHRRWWVFFGTGDRAQASKEGTVNRFYAILDSNYTSPLDESDLKRVSNSTPLTEAEIQAGTYRGWYIVFTDFNFADSLGARHGEKVTSYATILLDTLIFTTFQPTDVIDPCVSASGMARLYKIYYRSGGYAGTSPSTILGGGIPQAPRFSFDISGEGLQIINLPGEVIVTQTPNLGIRRKMLWWNETQ